MKRVALFEFDNVICQTLPYVLKQRQYNNRFKISDIDVSHQKRMNFHAYPMVMCKLLRDRGYGIHIYTRRKSFDRYGLVTEQWLNDKGFAYDELHMLSQNEPLINCISAYTYLVTTSVNDAIRLHNMSVLSSASIVNSPLNSNRQLPYYCNRLYYEC
jgi:hypothetical protein